jgi:hypothetical protein
MMLKAVAAAGIVLGTLVSCGHHTKMAEYQDPVAGWTISYPASMSRSVINDPGGHGLVHGVFVTNSERVRRSEDLFFRRFPPDAVAFSLSYRPGGGPPVLSPPEQRFPISRTSFTSERGAPPPVPLVHGMIANGWPWTVAVWFGPKASSADKDKIWRIVESIHFPPQRPGTMSGDFYVLGPASRYPVGAVVKYSGKQAPDRYSPYSPAFYFVHAPGGMYAVGWPPEFERKCHMGFDRKRHAFFCATRRGWWSRMGEPIQSPVAALLPDDSLMFGHAKIGRDGQVLVGDWWGLGGPQFKQYEWRFWPARG